MTVTIFPFNLKIAEMCCELKEGFPCYLYFLFSTLMGKKITSYQLKIL